MFERAPLAAPATRLLLAGAAAIALIVTLAGASGPATGDPNPATVVFLVRHAEKVDASADPDLSPEGVQRAQLLAGLMRDASVGRIHSTPYRRTEQTAAPVATALGLEVEAYDPRDLPGFANVLRGMGGRHLVVGHSNTTPALVRALGGDPGTPIDEAEYDRLYIVTIDGAGESTTVLIRFGAPYDPSMAKGAMRTPMLERR